MCKIYSEMRGLVNTNCPERHRRLNSICVCVCGCIKGCQLRDKRGWDEHCVCARVCVFDKQALLLAH